MAKFQNGDLFGIKSFDFFGLLVQLGEVFTKPRFGGEYQYTHTGMIVVKDNMDYVAEAIGEGFCLTPLANYDKKKWVIKRMTRIIPSQQEKLGAEALKRTTEKPVYNWGQTIWLGFAKLFRIEALPNPFKKEGSVNCSYGVADIYFDLGVHVFKDYKTGNTDPKDVMTDTAFYIVQVNNC